MSDVRDRLCTVGGSVYAMSTEDRHGHGCNTARDRYERSTHCDGKVSGLWWRSECTDGNGVPARIALFDHVGVSSGRVAFRAKPAREPLVSGAGSRLMPSYNIVAFRASGDTNVGRGNILASHVGEAVRSVRRKKRSVPGREPTVDC